MDERKRAVSTNLLARPSNLPMPGPACSRCSHSAESHMHGDPLACAYCALSPVAHTWQLGCSFYTPRTTAHSGASCRTPGCECLGYWGRQDGAW